jgi:DNA-binding MarR family transcriptional regulator
VVQKLTISGLCGTFAGIMSKYAALKDRHGIGNMSRSSKDIARAVLLSPDRSYEDIAEEFGVTRQRVGQIVRRLDIQRKAVI